MFTDAEEFTENPAQYVIVEVNLDPTVTFVGYLQFLPLIDLSDDAAAGCGSRSNIRPAWKDHCRLLLLRLSHCGVNETPSHGEQEYN
jgi:hypothetical protein